jgi:two-component system, NtrC family, sensor kinase
MATQTAITLCTKSNGREAEPQQGFYGSLEKFFTLTLDMFFIVGFDGYFKQLNPMCEKTLGYTTQELLNQRWMELIHPEDQQSTLEQLHKLTTVTSTVQFETRYRCKDGSYKWLLWNVTSCHEQQVIYAVARDHTECRRAEAARRESDEHFRLLVEGVKDYAIIMLDPDGQIVSWNSGAERIQQYQASEILGKHVSCFYTSEDIQAGKPEQGLDIAARQGRFEDEGWRVRKDRSKFWANVVITALQSEDGQLRGFVRVTRDITERKLAQEALQKAHDELEQRVIERTAELIRTNERLKQEIAEHERTEAALRQSKARLKQQADQLQAEKQHATALLEKLQRTQAQLIHTEKMTTLGQVIAGMAHEINNPVGFIYSNLDYAHCYVKDLMRLVALYAQHHPQSVPEIEAEKDAIDLNFLMADMPKLLSSMKVGATRLRQIALSLQNFLRTEQTEMKPIDLHEGLDSTLMILRHRLKASEEYPEITVSKEYGPLPLVECFAGQINQVFMHLLTNAIDVLQASTANHNTPRHIRIITGVENLSQEQAGEDTEETIPHAVIRIIDNGPGMSEEVCRRLFEPFFTTKPAGKGTGLGLSISYQIVVEKHGGQLTCISEPGKGAEFAIVLPVQQQSLSSQLSQCA